MTEAQAIELLALAVQIRDALLMLAGVGCASIVASVIRGL